MPTIGFTQPQWLIALPVLLAALWFGARGSYAGLRGWRLAGAWVVRVAIVLLVVLALAGTQIVRPAEKLTVVFALDDSYSVAPDEREQALEIVRETLREREPGRRAAMVVFGGEAMVESENLMRPDEVAVTSEIDGGHTDIEAGLRLALGLIPPETAGRVVLISDGNENLGDAAEQVLAAEAGRVSVDVLPLRTRSRHDAMVTGLRVPGEARREEPFHVHADVHATEPGDAELTVLVDDEPVQTDTLALSAGTRTLSVPISVSEPGFHRVDVVLEGAGDQVRENDVGTGFVRIRGEPKVLVVDASPEEAQALERALQLQEIQVRVGGPAALPVNAADLEAWDAVFLSDLPAYRMSHNQQEMLRDATRDRGIGLGMIGGEFGFGAGGYYGSPVEEALPVSMDVTKQRTFPAAAVLIVMDTSGSMGMEEDGYQKIELAAEAGCAVVDLLQPYDAVGFLASDPAPTAVAPLRKLTDREAIKSDIRSVRAGGGGIAVYPSLEAAYGVLRNDESPIRHIILLADGSDCDQQQGSVPLVRQMASEKITTTAVAFGDGPHVPFLKDVAAAGNGQYYLTERARDLKGIFTREALKVTKSVLVEETFRAQPADTSELTAGFNWSGAPPLMGYVATSRKDLARTPLVSHKDDPILAHWQFGLGRSVAFTSDAKAHWAAHWLQWPQFTRFWGQTVRWVLRRPGSEVLHPRVERRPDGSTLVVEAFDEDGSAINGLEVEVTLSIPAGGTEHLSLPQTGPGRYEAPVEARQAGAYVAGVVASGPEGFEARRTAGFAVPYPPDYADVAADRDLLQRAAAQTGGRVIERPEQVWAPPEVFPHTRIDIWRELLWLAALLLPLDVAIRRLMIRAEDFAPVWAAVQNATERLRPQGGEQEPATVGHLLESRRAMREKQDDVRVRPPQEIPDEAPSGERRPEAGPERAEPVEKPPGPEEPAPAEEKADEPEPSRTTAQLLKRKRQMRGEDD